VAEDNWNEELHNLESPSNITKPEISATCSMQVRGDKCTHSYWKKPEDVTWET
jgi:hypothetical protein